MNRKMVFYMIGKIVLAEAAMLLLPLVVALLYKETPLPFLITIGIASTQSTLSAGSNPA